MHTLKYRLIAIGASLGGAKSVRELLAALPESFGVPVAIVLHRAEDTGEELVDMLQRGFRLSVCEAEDKEPLAPGKVCLAPAGYHLLAEGDHFALSTEAPLNFARPSIDILFESAASCHGSKVIGIVLSGGGRDGAEGMKMIIARGGAGIVESPEAAESPEMPKAALEANPDAKAMRAGEMASFLETLAGKPYPEIKDLRFQI